MLQETFTQILSPHVSRNGLGSPVLRSDAHGNPVDPRVIVIHSTEGHEQTGSARNSAAWFKNKISKVSAHYVVDAAEVIQCVPDNQIAWHSGKANGFSLGIELVGKAEQTTANWLDTYSVAMLKRAAALMAYLCVKYNIPVAKLDETDVLANSKGQHLPGVCGHVDVSLALGGTHWDPGPGFPWLEFMLAVEGHRSLILAAR